MAKGSTILATCLLALCLLGLQIQCSGGGGSAPPQVPPAITVQCASETVTAPATATFSITATGNPLIYQWYLDGNAIVGAMSASYTTPATTLAMNGNSYACVVSGTGTPVTSNAAVLTVDAAPVITVEPASVTVADPATATFSVTATGNPAVTYQWDLNGTPIQDATTASYTTPATSLAMNGDVYTVTVSDGIGSPAVSTQAILTVDEVPAIAIQPASTLVTAPGTATFSVGATGNPLNYQWYANGSPIQGAIAASYTTPPTSLAMNGTSYTVTVSGIGSPAASSAAILTVDAAAAIITPPASATVTDPATATFSVTAAGNPAPSYQWNLNSQAISGATTASYTTPATTLAMNGNQYTVTVANGIGSPVTSPAATLTVDQVPAITVPPASATVTMPAAATFTVTATGNPLTYQWNLNGQAISGANAASYTTPATTPAMNGSNYTCTVSGIGSPVTSSAALLTVDTPAAITAAPVSVTVTDPATAQFSVTATGNPAPGYQWNLNGTAISGAISAIYTTPNTSLAMNGNQYTVTVGNGIGSPVTSAPATLTVDQVPAVTVPPASATVTAPAAAAFTVTATGNPLNYQWNLNGTAISGANAATYTTPATTPDMNGNSYTCTVSGVGSPVTSAAAILTVDTPAAITAAPASVTVTDPATAQFSVTASGNPAPGYQWNLNGTAISGATSAIYTTPNTSLAMNGNQYTVTVSNGIGAPVTSPAATLTVDQVAAITVPPASATVTMPTTATFTVTATGNPLNYQWNLNGTAISGATAASYTTPSTSLAMNGNSYTCTVSGTGSPVTSGAAILTVDAPPVITAAPASITVNVPNTAAFSVLATGNPAPSYQWNLNGTAISGATSASYTTPNTSLAMNGNQYTVTLSNGIGAAVTSPAATLTVDQGPVITTQPQPATVLAPTAATFSVAATGNPAPSYQWYANGVAIPGATGASYLTPATSAAMNSTTYTVTLSNGIGGPVTSTGALLTVNAAPIITAQPANLSVGAGSTATFTVAATGSPAPGYQWNLGGNPISGANAASYTTPATTLAMNNNSYTVTVTNGFGQITSSPAILTVTTAAAITTPPSSQTVTAPAAASFTVAATGNPAPTYQWNLNGTAISGATAATYGTGPTSPAMNGGVYTVTVFNGLGSPVTSAGAVLIVDFPAAFSAPPAAVSVNVPATATFNVTATGNPAPTYQWNLNGNPISGANAASYTTLPTTLAMNGSMYSVTVGNGIGSAVTSPAVALTVTQGPVFTTQPQPTTVLAPTQASFSVTATGNPAPSYQWYVNGTAIPGATGASYQTPATTVAMNNTTYTVTLNNGIGGPVTSTGALLTVNAAPAITAQPANISVGAGSTATFNVTATGNPAPGYQWNLGGNPISGANAASYTTPATTLAMNNASYTVTVTNTYGQITSNPAILTVTTAAVITTPPSSQTVTAPAAASFTVAATGNPAPTYQWNLNGTAISGATAATYGTGPTSPAMNGGVYTVTVFNGLGSPVTSAGAVLTVDFPAAISSPPAAVSVNVPATATFNVTATGNPAPTYQWNLNGNPISGANAASYTTLPTTLAMNGSMYSVTVGNGIGSAVTSPAVALTVTQGPVFTTQPQPTTVLAPTQASFSVTATGNPLPTYQWNVNGSPIPGATAASYQTPSTTVAMNNNVYTVTLNNGIGGPVTSTGALLTVNAAPAITGQPQNTTVNTGNTATFNVTATGNPAPGYQWNLGGNPIAGANGPSYTTPATDSSMNNNVYTVTVTNSYGQITSNQATLTVTNAASITTQPSSETVTAPAQGIFTVVAAGVPDPTYQWKRNGVPITGATASSYTTPSTTLADNGAIFTVTVSNGVGTPVTSNQAVLTVYAQAAITTQPVGQTLSVGGTLHLSVVASGNPAPYQYQWYFNGSPISYATGSDYYLYSAGAGNSGNYYVTVYNGIGNSVTSDTVTVTVNATYSISGAVRLVNTSGQPTLPTMSLSIDTNPPTAAVTDQYGNFSFPAVPSGSYTITPLPVSGAASVFYPAALAVAVANSNVNAGVNFTVDLGYTVSGTIAYSGSHKGPIYMTLQNRFGNNNDNQPGTSIPAAGNFAIRGVRPGQYSLSAFMDILGEAYPNANDPSGTASGTFTVSTADVTGQYLAISDQGANLAGQSGPGGFAICPFDSGAFIFCNALYSNGVEQAQSYTVDWSESAGFSPLAGSKTFPPTNQTFWVLSSGAGLVDGHSYYFRVRGNAGSTSTNYTITPSATLINPGSGAHTISGTVTYPGIATGPLYVGFYDGNKYVYMQPITNPVSPQPFSVSGIPSGSYQFFALIDQNNDGVPDAGDLTNLNLSMVPTTVSGDLPGQSIVIPSGAFTGSVATEHSMGPGYESYGLNFSVNGSAATITGLALVSGPNLLVPQDLSIISITNGMFNWQSRQSGIQARPQVNDTYGVQLGFSDGSSVTLNPQVTAVLDSFAQNLEPSGFGIGSGGGTSTAPVFTWTAPSAPPAGYTYDFDFQIPNNNDWYVPGNANSFTSAITSITWGVDPTSAGNTPPVSSLTLGTTYSWGVGVYDTLGNAARANVNYTPGGITAAASVAPNATGLTASVQPVTGATSYSWGISGGTITGGQGTDDLTFSTGSSGSVTLTCVIYKGGTPVNSWNCTIPIQQPATRTVQGSALVTYLPFDAGTGTITPQTPVPYGFSSVNAVLPDGTTVIPGAYDPVTGTYAIPNVPAGFYWLHAGSNYIGTTLGTVDLNWNAPGRPGVAYPTLNTPAVFDTAGMVPWNSNDTLLFYDFNSGLYCNPDQAASSGYPATGDTTLNSLTMNWLGFPLLDTTQGDAPRLMQTVDSILTGSEHLGTQAKLYLPAPVTLADGASYTYGGTFADIPQDATVYLNYSRSQFTALRPQYNPNGTFGWGPFIEVDFQPGAAAYGDISTTNWMDGLYVQNSNPTITADINLGSQPAPSAPAGYDPIYYAGENYFMHYQVPGTSYSWKFKVHAARPYSLTPSDATHPIAPNLGPVRNPTINGASLFSNQTGVGTTPTIAWTAPSLGKPQGYVISIYQLFAEGSYTTGGRIAKLFLDGSRTSALLPAGILTSGNYYFIMIAAYADSTYNPLAAPFGTRQFPFDRSQMATNMFTP